jgi:hypothetical protein
MPMGLPDKHPQLVAPIRDLDHMLAQVGDGYRLWTTWHIRDLTEGVKRS